MRWKDIIAFRLSSKHILNCFNFEVETKLNVRTDLLLMLFLSLECHQYALHIALLHLSFKVGYDSKLSQILYHVSSQCNCPFSPSRQHLFIPHNLMFMYAVTFLLFVSLFFLKHVYGFLKKIYLKLICICVLDNVKQALTLTFFLSFGEIESITHSQTHPTEDELLNIVHYGRYAFPRLLQH